MTAVVGKGAGGQHVSRDLPASSAMFAMSHHSTVPHEPNSNVFSNGVGAAAPLSDFSSIRHSVPVPSWQYIPVAQFPAVVMHSMMFFKGIFMRLVLYRAIAIVRGESATKQGCKGSPTGRVLSLVLPRDPLSLKRYRATPSFMACHSSLGPCLYFDGRRT